MPGTPETILAFDFGLRRIGIAVGQQVTRSAGPVAVIANRDGEPDWLRIGDLVREWQPVRLIVGMPLHGDGSPSEISSLVRSFISQLDRFGLPVESVDERYTSLEAGAHLKAGRRAGQRGRIRKESIDAGAAVLIAERWLKNESG